MGLRIAFAGALALLLGTGGFGDSHKITIYLRGKAQRVRIYEPAAGAPRRPVQVLVVSGDLGGLGISRNVPGHLQAQGYRVVALNAQTYVAGFTTRKTHLTDEQVARDFDTIVEAANVDARGPTPYVSLGVSEGAGLAVVAA